MYAVFEDGSRQYRVSEGDLVQVDFRDVDIGGQIEFGRILLYKDGDDLRVGEPILDGFRILGEVVKHPTTKLFVQHFRRRKNYRRLRGHRQPYTAVRIESILLPGMQPKPARAETKAPAAREEATPAAAPSSRA